MSWLIQRGPILYYGHRKEGKVRYKSTGTSDKIEAEKLQKKWDYEETLENPIHSTNEDMPFDDLIRLYKNQADIKPRTIRTNEYSWKKFVLLTGVKTVRHAIAENIVKVFKEKAEGVIGATYQALILRDMRKLIRYAIKKGICKDNPYSGVSMPEQEEVFRILTPEEEAALLISHEDLTTLIEFELKTGLRESQLVTLDWKQFDARRNILKIPPQKRQRKRDIPVYGDLLQLMGTPKPSGHIFPQFDGMDEATGCNWIKARWKTAKRRADIQGRLRFHDLRHTCASRLAQILKPQEVRDFFGWSSMALVDRYVHSDVEEIRRKLDAA